MKEIATVDAVGCVLCHDLTRIVRGESKDAAFRRGHVVRESDVPVLLSMGKDRLYVWEDVDGMLHEDAAAEILADICRNDGMSATPVKEGKIELIAQRDGLFVVDAAKLAAINSLDGIAIATRHSGFPVKKGDRLAGFRVIPLTIAIERMEKAKEAAGGVPLFQLLPFHPLRTGIIATGNEIFHNRIKDTFTPVVDAKLREYGIAAERHAVCPDDVLAIAGTLRDMLASGLELILCTGGMSVDPDDRTPGAIKAAGADIVSYGAPVLPGAMFLMAYKGDSAIVGLPGCVMYEERTIFDILLPRIVAKRRVSRGELRGLGEGGLCLRCRECIFPACGFGKGERYG